MRLLSGLLLLFLAGCGIPYDGETIINIEGRVVDAYNQPLPNQRAYLGASYGDNGYDTATYKTVTDGQGAFRLTLFRPNEGAELIFEENSTYLPLFCTGLHTSNFSGLQWNLGTLVRYKTTDLVSVTIVVNTVNPNSILEQLNLTGMIYTPNYDFNTLTTGDPISLDYQVRKNQTCTLQYKVKNGLTQQVSELTVPLVIAESNVTYTLNL
jgi:hypothetical protein